MGETGTNLPDEFRIDGVPRYPQIDNKYKPYVSCAPTSLGMAMGYCLGKVGLDKRAVGCGLDMQIEDYINHLIDDADTQAWIKANDLRYGGWFQTYIRKGNAARQILAVDAYVFTRLMLNIAGFKATYRALAGYNDYCQTIQRTQLPVVVAGNFSSVSRVGGHVLCGIGYNRVGLQELIVNDPFGDALQGYPFPNEALERRYAPKFFLRGSPARIDAIIIEAVG